MANFIPVEPEKWAEMVKALAEVERLKAEVERLRKAGDAMAEEIQKHLTNNQGLGKTNNWWNAAKEGKQS